MRIAISGLSGVGTTSTAKLVSQKLGIPLSTYTLRDLAKDRGVDFEVIHQEAKKHNPEIDWDLDRHHIEFLHSHEDAIVASDLACWLDNPKIYEKLSVPKPQLDLKIWLEATPDARAKRREKREESDSQELVEYDEGNIDHYRQVYGIDIGDRTDIDWVFRTTDIPLEEVVNQICQRVEQMKT